MKIALLNKVELVVSSPLSRALQTSEFILTKDIVPQNVRRIALPLARERCCIDAIQVLTTSMIRTIALSFCLSYIIFFRLYLSGDVGRNISALSTEFPTWDFSACSESDWWYSDPISMAKLSETSADGLLDYNFSRGLYKPETNISFTRRMNEFKNWIMNRNERTIAIVAHWGVLRAITGRNFQNAEIYHCNASELLENLMIR